MSRFTHFIRKVFAFSDSVIIDDNSQDQVGLERTLTDAEEKAKMLEIV